MQYPLPEGNFNTVTPVLDQSMNILVFQDHESKSNYTLIINRDRQEAGETLAGYCQRQIKVLARQFEDFVQDGDLMTDTRENGIRYARFHTRFHQGGAPVHQAQIVVQLDESGKVIIFTLSGTAAFNDAQALHYSDAVQSFIDALPHQRTG
jgi:hypothetical protein